MIYWLNPKSSSNIEKMETVLREKIIHKGIEMILFHKFLGVKYRINGNIKEENPIPLVGYVKEGLNVPRDIACVWMEGCMEI